MAMAQWENRDSKAALFSMKLDDTWTYKLLSVDHKPGYQGEMQRIIKAGGRVESQEQKKYNTNQNQQNTNQNQQNTNQNQQNTKQKNNNMKMWLKNIQAPGLAISRSFGDYLGSKIGLIAEPDIFQFNLNNYDKFIVMGSNGLWEFLNLDQILNIVNEYYEQRYINQLAAQQAADYLIDLAQQKWVQNDSLIDDITVIVVFLKGSQQNPINNLVN
ncbi:Protein phosphatase 2C (PP2C)-like domain [Pseudocohnilembus persalinus]|uniref:Protein phosphatase 2C (PP2C)-like domain n=1 Tax=Pseudocohnilembus persalinus TaxID=266149 RepID=A0A0V0QN88_PSEPJ|nr:Protein phosphatase 2C (PP2C)-like domain [Pseudocohnilembus persalinus]|eukprot:KRX03413.1 Protein phosphatase 2C (PP2C)-like domain [Pseudocohnilembus persalinus]